MTCTGILAIDVSWKGMGCVAFAGEHLLWSKCYDIRGTLKRFDLPLHTAQLVSNWVKNELIVDCPWLVDVVDMVIVENQFHLKMKYLQYMVTSSVLTAIYGAKVKFISALTCKRSFNVPLQKSHNQNKKIMLKFVRENSHSLFAGCLHQNNDNIADAIILLNTFINSRKKSFLKPPTMTTYENYPQRCTVCDQDTIWLNTVKKEGPNLGKQFTACKNNCPGVFAWAKTTSKKRPLPDDIRNDNDNDNTELLKKFKCIIYDVLDEFRAEMRNEAQQTNTEEHQ